ncbi:MAG TPA: hypothetical protein VGR57_11095 [Ktedonobacterales bacterium]|nr:hypothetical protein [Ktedonobacterales bacterium]
MYEKRPRRLVGTALREFGLLGITFQLIVSQIMVVIFGVFVYIMVRVLAAYNFSSVTFQQLAPIVMTGLIVLSGLVAAGMIGLVFTFLLGEMRKALSPHVRSVAPEEPIPTPPGRDQRLLAPPQNRAAEEIIIEREDTIEREDERRVASLR